MKLIITLAIAATLFMSNKPTTFKTDMENAYYLINGKLTALAGATTHQDSVNLFADIDAAFLDLNSKWDVAQEMRNAATIWPFNPVLVCAMGCLRNYNQCVSENTPGTFDGATLCAIWYNQCRATCHQ